MTEQDYDDIVILKHAAEDILRYVKQLVVDAQPYELESEELIEKGKLLDVFTPMREDFLA
jgi:hypothetical protein